MKKKLFKHIFYLQSKLDEVKYCRDIEHTEHLHIYHLRLGPQHHGQTMEHKPTPELQSIIIH